MEFSLIAHASPHGEHLYLSFPTRRDMNLLASLVAQSVKNPPAMQEMQVRSLSQEDLLEKEMATHSSILAWESPWTEDTGRLQFVGLARVEHD